MGRAILAVVVGYVVWTVVWLGGGAALAAVFPDQPNEAGVYDNAAMLGVLLALSVVCSLLGGMTCGKITRGKRRAPMVLAVLLLLTGIGVQAGAWSAMPIWFHIPFLLLLVPVTWLAAGLVKPAK